MDFEEEDPADADIAAGSAGAEVAQEDYSEEPGADGADGGSSVEAGGGSQPYHRLRNCFDQWLLDDDCDGDHLGYLHPPTATQEP